MFYSEPKKEQNMKKLNLIIVLILFVVITKGQENFPIIKSNVNVISIQDGDILKKDNWTLTPEAKPDVYETNLLNGKPKKVTFITDIDQISFTIEEGKKYDFIIQKGDTKCYTQIVGRRSFIWGEKSFWESPALKTPYKPNLSDEEKIAGLSKFWSEAKYNFINWDKAPPIDWDAAYLEFIPKVLATKSTLEYYRVLQVFCKKLGDGHTGVFTPDELDDELFGKPAIATRLVEGKVILTAVFDKNLNLKVGQEIVEIDGLPIKEYAEKNVAPYVSESTPQAFDSSIYQYNLLAGSINKPVELTLKDFDGKTFKKNLPRLKLEERGKLIPQSKPFEMTMLPNNIAHVKVNTMVDQGKADQMFADAYPEIQKSDALIIDLRNNGGGSSGIGYRILAFLVDKPFKGSRWFTREYHPTFRPWGRAEKTFGDEAYTFTEANLIAARGKDTKVYDKPVIVLTSPRTGSAAEDFLVAFKPLKRGLIIGEPSNGSTGQPLQISLPGGGSARICSKRDTFADGTEFVGVGVIPDILALPRVSDFTENKDAVLEKALLELAKSLKK